MEIISYGDLSGLSYEPADDKYWDEKALEKELLRTFEICHGCRLCFKYCPSFPSLFQALDGPADGDVHKLNDSDRSKIIGECYQCKVCYIKCPYTDRDEHAYNLNFPALMQRAVHQDARKNGVPIREKILQNADLAGKMNGGLLSGLVNRMMDLNFHRSIMQVLLGIHKSKKLPEFHRRSFASWFQKNREVVEGPLVDDTGKERVVLFSTCFVNYNNPGLGIDTLTVLEKNGVDVAHPEQNCCGMPGINSGDLDFAVKKMKANVDSLLPYAQAGYKILAINPTCSLTLKDEYETFLPPGQWRENARVIAAATMDLMEYLFYLKRKGVLNREFKSVPDSVAYHVPCHLRAQNIGFRSRDIMRLIPGAKIGQVDECCGHNGTWAMKKEYFAMSLDAGKRAFDGLADQGATHTATDCPLAAIQLEQGMELKERPVHPIQILARAYLSPDEGGFPTEPEL